MKKANISINLVIAIVLVLIVVFVLLFKFKDSIITVNQFGSCEQQGGICVEEGCDGRVVSYDCDDKKYCCMDEG